MTPEQVLSIKPKILRHSQRESYFQDGYLLLEAIVPMDWIERLRAATRELVERSRCVGKSNKIFDLEPDHRADEPRVRRVSGPEIHHPEFWEYPVKSLLADVVADLVGPDVKFHHAKLNFKWKKGGEEVKWHYDIGFWPHTNYSPLTVGTYLYDCGPDQGPLGVIPGSHRIEPMLSQYNTAGKWVGCLGDADVKKLDLSDAKYLTGPAGSLTLHNCRTIHGSPRNTSDLGRPLLLYTMSSADAFPYTANPIGTEHSGKIVRGRPAAFAHHDPRPCLMPPDWSGGYTSIFALQQGDSASATGAM